MGRSARAAYSTTRRASQCGEPILDTLTFKTTYGAEPLSNPTQPTGLRSCSSPRNPRHTPRGLQLRRITRSTEPTSSNDAVASVRSGSSSGVLGRVDAEMASGDGWMEECGSREVCGGQSRELGDSSDSSIDPAMSSGSDCSGRKGLGHAVERQ